MSVDIAQVRAVIEGLARTVHDEFHTEDWDECGCLPRILAELPDDGVIVSAELAAFAGAWDAVQKALPDYIAALAAKSGDEPWVGRWSPALSGANGHYVAWVVDTEEGWVDDTSHYADAIGPTPTAALVALRKTLEAAK